MTKLYPTLVALMAAGFVSGHAMALTKAEYELAHALHLANHFAAFDITPQA